MKLFWKLLLREFKHFATSPIALLIFIGAPIAYSLLIGFVYRDAAVKDLPIIVVDLDNTPLSNKIIDALDDNQYVKVARVQYNTGNLRNELMLDGYHAIVTIPKGFEGDIQQKRYSEIDADVNGANMLTANFVSTGLQTVLATINVGLEVETLKKKGMPANIAAQQYEPFKINITRFFNPASNYLYFMWPGVLGTIMQQVFLLVLALSFAKEFEEKTFDNLLRYSKNPWYLILLKSLPYWIIGIALWLPLIRGSFAFFHVQMMDSQGAFYLVSSLFIISLAFMGIAASILFKTQLKATEVLMIVATPSFLISGQTWPLAQMPVFIQGLAQIIPLTHFLEAFRKLLLYKGDLSSITHEINWLLGLSVVYLGIAYAALKYRITNKSYKMPRLKRVKDFFSK